MEKPLQCPSCHFLAALVNNVSFEMHQGHFFSFYVINAQHTVIMFNRNTIIIFVCGCKYVLATPRACFDPC